MGKSVWRERREGRTPTAFRRRPRFRLEPPLSRQRGRVSADQTQQCDVTAGSCYTSGLELDERKKAGLAREDYSRHEQVAKCLCASSQRRSQSQHSTFGLSANVDLQAQRTWPTRSEPPPSGSWRASTARLPSPSPPRPPKLQPSSPWPPQAALLARSIRWLPIRRDGRGVRASQKCREVDSKQRSGSGALRGSGGAQTFRPKRRVVVQLWFQEVADDQDVSEES